MTTMTLDVASLHSFEYKGVQLADLVDKIKQTVEFWGRIGIVKDVDSFGFAVVLQRELADGVWDDPSEYVSFVGGWGPDEYRYIANAVRKLRAAIRNADDTLTLLDQEDLLEEGATSFLTPVGSQNEDGSIPWGDFPYGGAAYVNFGEEELLVGVSALSQEEDDLVASFIGKLIGKTTRRA